MAKPRFRLWMLMVFVPIAALLIAAGHDLLMMSGPPDDDGDNIPGWVLLLLMGFPCGALGLFILIVFLASRGDRPPT